MIYLHGNKWGWIELNPCMLINVREFTLTCVFWCKRVIDHWLLIQDLWKTLFWVCLLLQKTFKWTEEGEPEPRNLMEGSSSSWWWSLQCGNHRTGGLHEVSKVYLLGSRRISDGLQQERDLVGSWDGVVGLLWRKDTLLNTSPAAGVMKRRAPPGCVWSDAHR